VDQATEIMGRRGANCRIPAEIGIDLSIEDLGIEELRATGSGLRRRHQSVRARSNCRGGAKGCAQKITSVGCHEALLSEESWKSVFSADDESKVRPRIG
jgi:hypothetical protein